MVGSSLFEDFLCYEKEKVKNCSSYKIFDHFSNVKKERQS